MISSDELLNLRGRFVGPGINHEAHPFTGVLEAEPAGAGRGLAFSYQAYGADGTLYHAESSLVSRSPNGPLTLFIVSSNHSGAFERTLKLKERTSDGRFVYVFAHGDPLDTRIYREEIRFEVSEHTFRYVYSWGRPEGEFKERSGCLMKRIE